MNTTFDISNIVPDLKTMEMVVFYRFSNGETYPKKFPANTSVDIILGWGQEKCTWFDEREILIQEIRNRLIEEENQEPIE